MVVMIVVASCTGANVRADTTLIGFDQNDWQRGNRSYVFKGGGNR